MSESRFYESQSPQGISAYGRCYDYMKENGLLSFNGFNYEPKKFTTNDDWGYEVPQEAITLKAAYLAEKFDKKKPTSKSNASEKEGVLLVEASKQ